MKPHWIIPIVLALFLLPFGWRFIDNATISGELSYYYLDTFPFSVMPLSSFGHWILASAVTLLFVLLVSRLVGQWTDGSDHLIVLLFFVGTPATIYLSSQPTIYLYALVLVALALNLVSSRYPLLMLLPLAGLLLFDWITVLCASIIITAYLLFVEKKHLAWAVAGLLSTFFIIHSIYTRPFAFEILAERTLLTELFSDLGGVYGISLFVFLLALIGLVITWSKKRMFIPLYCAVLLLLALFFLNRAALLFLYPLLSLLAGYAFLYFWQREWTLPFVHFLTIAVLGYGMLFSALSYVTVVVNDKPTPEMLESTAWLRDHPFYKDDVVLSLPEYGYILGYGSHPFVTPMSADYELRLNVSNALFHSRDLKRTEALMVENEISMIWMDAAMRTLWKSDDGLLYLFRASGRFVKVYDDDGIEMWRLKD
ncbi:MAG TPA: hypothetical protein VJH88_05515 [Candidatus Nanoarchaeia archaeon]|nr:hypothetical protein [Candidatus Nanoarchaeia archaeon]